MIESMHPAGKLNACSMRLGKVFSLGVVSKRIVQFEIGRSFSCKTFGGSLCILEILGKDSPSRLQPFRLRSRRAPFKYATDRMELG